MKPRVWLLASLFTTTLWVFNTPDAAASFIAGCTLDVEIEEVIKRSIAKAPAPSILEARFKVLRVVDGGGHAPNMCARYPSKPPFQERLSARDGALIEGVTKGSRILVAFTKSDGLARQPGGDVRHVTGASWRVVAPVPGPLMFGFRPSDGKLLHWNRRAPRGCCVNPAAGWWCDKGDKRMDPATAKLPPRHWVMSSWTPKGVRSGKPVTRAPKADRQLTWKDLKAFGRGFVPLEVLSRGGGQWFHLKGLLRGQSMRLSAQGGRVEVALERSHRTRDDRGRWRTKTDRHVLGHVTAPKSAVAAVKALPGGGGDVLPKAHQVSLIERNGKQYVLVAFALLRDGACTEGRMHFFTAPVPTKWMR